MPKRLSFWDMNLKWMEYIEMYMKEAHLCSPFYFILFLWCHGIVNLISLEQYILSFVGISFITEEDLMLGPLIAELSTPFSVVQLAWCYSWFLLLFIFISSVFPNIWESLTHINPWKGMRCHLVMKSGGCSTSFSWYMLTPSEG